MSIEKRHLSKLKKLRQFFLHHGHVTIPSNEEYADLYEWTQSLRQTRINLSEALLSELGQITYLYIIG